jgi:threonyl-tRNA synthetase
VAITDLILGIYRDFGFDDIRIKFSDRPEKRVGSDAIWDRAEAALRSAAEAAGLELEYNPGEGAFYGPKLEFVLRDAIGRDWQCGTLQVDFNMPERLGASYVGDDSQRRTPVMLHRAMFGSLSGSAAFCLSTMLPVAGRLAPVQVAILNITDRQAEYAGTIQKSCEIRVFGLRWT